MPEPLDLKLKEGIMPTVSSLSLAKKISILIGERFDQDAVAQKALILHDRMFTELTDILEIDTKNIRFQYGVHGIAKAFVGKNKENYNHIILDIVFDYCIFALSHFSIIATFKVLDKTEWKKMLADIVQTFQLFDDAHQYEVTREILLPYLVQYGDCLNLSYSIARAMLVFALCHELAHIDFEHLEKDISLPLSLELEADELAVEYFLKLVKYGEHSSDTHVHVDTKVACAPLLLMQLFTLHEKWCYSKKSAETTSYKHMMSERLIKIHQKLYPHLSKKSRYLIEGMTKGISDIGDDLLE